MATGRLLACVLFVAAGCQAGARATTPQQHEPALDAGADAETARAEAVDASRPEPPKPFCRTTGELWAKTSADGICKRYADGCSLPPDTFTQTSDEESCRRTTTCGRAGTEISQGPDHCNTKICDANGHWDFTLVGCRVSELRADDSAGTFNRAALAAEVQRAKERVETCASSSAPDGDGHIVITLQSSGIPSKEIVDQPPLAGSVIAPCIEKVFAGIRIPPFSNGPITFGASFSIHPIHADGGVLLRTRDDRALADGGHL